MCSELFRIPLQIAGVPLFSGVLMIVWLLVAGVGMTSVARHDGWKAATAGHLPTFAVGALLLLFLPRYFPDGVPVRGYGVMLIVGSGSGIALATLRARQVGLDPEEILPLAIWLFAAGIAGGRLFYVVEYWGQRFQQIDPATGRVDWTATIREALNFTEGGLVVYGAFLGATAAFIAYTLRRKLPVLAMADLIAPSLAVGLAFGRIGCLMNGCCYGGESAAPWAISFPRENAPGRLSPPFADQARNGRFHGFRIGAVDDQSLEPIVTQVDADSPAAASGLQVGDRIAAINGEQAATVDRARQLLMHSLVAAPPDQRSPSQQHRPPLRLRLDTGEIKQLAQVAAPIRSRAVHPTQIYSAVNAGLLAWLLWSYYPWRRRDGQVAALMLTLYPIARFLLEMIRIDENAVFGTGLSISQNISIAVLLGAAIFWTWLQRQPPRRAAFPVAVSAAA